MPRACLAVVLLAMTWFAAASPAAAQPRLPYQAYGSGVAPNATVEALHNDAVLSSTRADAQGNWMLQVPPGVVEDGRTIAFRVNGKRAQQTIDFRSARFSAPPGLMLTVEGQPTAGLEPGASTSGGSTGAPGGGTPGAGTGAPGVDASGAPSETDEAGSVLVWAAVIGVLAVAIGAGAVLLMRRRSAAGD